MDPRWSRTTSCLTSCLAELPQGFGGRAGNGGKDSDGGRSAKKGQVSSCCAWPSSLRWPSSYASAFPPSSLRWPPSSRGKLWRRTPGLGSKMYNVSWVQCSNSPRACRLHSLMSQTQTCHSFGDFVGFDLFQELLRLWVLFKVISHRLQDEVELPGQRRLKPGGVSGPYKAILD